MFLTNNDTRTDNTHIWFGFVRAGFSIIILLLLLIHHEKSSYTFFIQDPLWWIMIFFWIGVITSTLILQMMHVRLKRVPPFFFRLRQQSYTSNTLQRSELTADNTSSHMIALTTQVVAALELPFQHIGLRTENHRPEIEKAVRSLYSHTDPDKQVFSNCLQQLLQETKQNWIDLAVFSSREREIMELLSQDISYREMSERLYVSISTIKTHVYHIFQKLNISSREEAIRLIHERSWFYLNEAVSPSLRTDKDPLLAESEKRP